MSNDTPASDLVIEPAAEPVIAPLAEPTILEATDDAPSAPEAPTPEASAPPEAAQPFQPTDQTVEQTAAGSDEAGEVVPDPDITIYRSAFPENYEFDVMGIYPRRAESTRHLLWHVPVEDAERFERHYFVQSGRIVRTQ